MLAFHIWKTYPNKHHLSQGANSLRKCLLPNQLSKYLKEAILHFQNDCEFQEFPRLIKPKFYQYVFKVQSFLAIIFGSTHTYPLERKEAKKHLLLRYEIIVQQLYNSFPEHSRLTSHNLKMLLIFFLLNFLFPSSGNIRCP